MKNELPIPAPEYMESLSIKNLKAKARDFVAEMRKHGVRFSLKQIKRGAIRSQHFLLTFEAKVPRSLSGLKLGLRKRREILRARIV